MSKETAVEYMYRLLDVMTFDKDSESADIWEAIYHRAFAMEREQIIDAHGLKYYDLNEETVTGEQYYLKTYKGGEQ